VPKNEMGWLSLPHSTNSPTLLPNTEWSKFQIRLRKGQMAMDGKSLAKGRS